MRLVTCYEIDQNLEGQMSLFPEENISTREIESWKGFATLAVDSNNSLGAPFLYKHANYAILSSYNNDISYLF
jgi:hypothetical protein